MGEKTQILYPMGEKTQILYPMVEILIKLYLHKL